MGHPTRRTIKLPDLHRDRMHATDHPVRRRALDVIRVAAGPLTTRQIAERIEWPLTTMKIRELRTLLQPLEWVGLVEVDRPACCGRGRQNTYRAAPSAGGAR